MHFTAYALVGLVHMFSSFFFTLLETYGLQLQHLMPHSITLVAVFMHLYKMYVGMRPSVHLFMLYHLLCSPGHDARPLGGYYFQHRVKRPTPYIAALTPDKWDHWRHDWVVMQGEIHDRLVLLTATLCNRSHWEKVPDLQSEYCPVKRSIQFLAEKGLTSMMVLHDFMSKRIDPLLDRSHLAWMYTGLNDTTRLEHGDRSDLEPDMLATTLSKMSTNLTSLDFIMPLELCASTCLNLVARSLLLSEMPSMDDIDLTARQVGDPFCGMRIPGMGDASIQVRLPASARRC
jgi:hypothetical protein